MASSGSGLQDIFSDQAIFEEMFGIPLRRFENSADSDSEEELEEEIDDVEKLLCASVLQEDYLDLSGPPLPALESTTVEETAIQEQDTQEQESSTLPTPAELQVPLFESNWHDSNFHEVPVDPFQEETGIAVDVPENPSALDLFSLYFHLETFQHIADETNKYAEWVQQQRGKVDATWKPTSAEEMKAFVGCTIMMAINSLPVLHMYWMQDPFLRNDGITAVFTRDRYKKMSQYFHLNDNTKQKKKGEDGYDILYKIRPILDMCTTTFQTVVKPAKELSVDEGMIKYKGRVSFLQYMPKKPVKRGIKVRTHNHSSTRETT